MIAQPLHSPDSEALDDLVGRFIDAAVDASVSRFCLKLRKRMDRSIEKELSSFIRVWRFLGPTMIIISLGMVFLSWPDRWLSLLVFFLALLFGFFTLKHTRMAGKALDLVRHGQPQSCEVEIRKESGDDRDYVMGTVYRESKDTWNISFTPPLWNVDPFLQKTFHAKVYFEPQTGYPLIVATDGGHLWAERVPTKVNSSATNGLQQRQRGRPTPLSSIGRRLRRVLNL